MPQNDRSMSRATGFRSAVKMSQAAAVPMRLWLRQRRTQCAGRATKPLSTSSMSASATAEPTSSLSSLRLMSTSVRVTLSSIARAIVRPPVSPRPLSDTSSVSSSQPSVKISATRSPSFAPMPLPPTRRAVTTYAIHKYAASEPPQTRIAFACLSLPDRP